ncbi:MAG TPA: hypothetical protein DEB57_12325, partial [Microbacterium sp.]|nr:hypothetical protein [Microbacterium sp.]
MKPSVDALCPANASAPRNTKRRVPALRSSRSSSTAPSTGTPPDPSSTNATPAPTSPGTATPAEATTTRASRAAHPWPSWTAAHASSRPRTPSTPTPVPARSRCSGTPSTAEPNATSATDPTPKPQRDEYHLKQRPNKKASIRELALELGVSTATVSRALNNNPSVSEETRTRVLELADQAGYMPRVGQRFRNVVGLVYPSNPVTPEFGSFESALLTGVMKGLDADRYDLALIDIQRDRAKSESYTQFFRRKGVRGVIIRPVSPEPTIADAIADEGFPCVMVADRSDHPNIGFICSDSGRDSFRAVDHLVHLGHQRIALVCHAVLDSDHRDRVEGYRRALAEHGIERDESIELFLPASMEGGAQAIDRLLSHENPPTAIFITNPVPTVGALHRCLELGIRVPDDLSIVGFD